MLTTANAQLFQLLPICFFFTCVVIVVFVTNKKKNKKKNLTENLAEGQ